MVARDTRLAEIELGLGYFFRATMLVARADIDGNEVSPKNAEVGPRFRFERDLIGEKY
jgi:hypothetical protein